jgi:hypothetical protein
LSTVTVTVVHRHVTLKMKSTNINISTAIPTYTTYGTENDTNIHDHNNDDDTISSPRTTRNRLSSIFPPILPVSHAGDCSTDDDNDNDLDDLELDINMDMDIAGMTPEEADHIMSESRTRRKKKKKKQKSKSKSSKRQGCCRCCRHLHICQIFDLLLNDRSNLKIALLRLLPSILVMKAFWLSLASIGTCDLAHIYVNGGVDGGSGGTMNNANNNATNNAHNNATNNAHNGINVQSFGLFSYAKVPVSQTIQSQTIQSQGSQTIQNSTNINRNNNNMYYPDGQEGDNIDNNLAMNNNHTFWNDTTDVLEEFGSHVELVLEEELGTCHALDPHFFIMDGKFHAARVSGVAGVVLGLIATVIIWIHTCRSVAKRTWRLSGILVFICCLCEGLTLLIFRTGLCRGQGLQFPLYNQEHGGLEFQEGGLDDGLAQDYYGSSSVASDGGGTSSTSTSTSTPTNTITSMTLDCQLARGAEATIAAAFFWFATLISMSCVPSNSEYTWAMQYASANRVTTDDEANDGDGEYNTDDNTLPSSSTIIGYNRRSHHHLYQVEEGHNEDEDGDDSDNDNCDNDDKSTCSFNYT